MKINGAKYGEKLYKATIRVGATIAKSFMVYALNKNEAKQLASEHAESNGLNLHSANIKIKKSFTFFSEVLFL